MAIETLFLTIFFIYVRRYGINIFVCRLFGVNLFNQTDLDSRCSRGPLHKVCIVDAEHGNKSDKISKSAHYKTFTDHYTQIMQ